MIKLLQEDSIFFNNAGKTNTVYTDIENSNIVNIPIEIDNFYSKL